MTNEELTTKSRPNRHQFQSDDLDYAVICRAIAIRQRMSVFPDSGSDATGAALAEICRGWLDCLGEEVI